MIQIKQTKTQLLFFIIQTQIGVGILSLPYSVFQRAKQDGWMSILLAGLVVQLLILLFWMLAKRFPELSYFRYLKLILGTYIGNVVTIAYTIYGVLVSALILMFSTKVIKTWLLIYTPKWIVMSLLVLTAIMLAREHVLTISNIYILVSGLVLFLLFMSLVVLGTYPVEIRYLFPIGKEFGMNMISGAEEAGFSMFGFEMLLLLFPYFNTLGEKSILKTVSLASWLVTLLYLTMFLICAVVFSPSELLIIPQPVLYFVKSINLQIIERIDLIFLSLWIVNVITSLTSYLFFSLEGSRNLLKGMNKKKGTWCLMGFGSVSFSIALMVDITKIEVYHFYVMNLSYMMVVILPIIILILSLILKRKGENSG
ncbi:GerAB/ArcD/ProY family transporter [Rossellomorea marisflavi]|uniref:GerAB/ArcD/ProY family transporter n=1 Tax=Rossellomorea marisflavi TaxID=189381 RepID=UPI003D27477A